MHSFFELICNASIAKLGLGSVLGVVFEVLGEPEDVSTFKSPLIYKYGILQVTIDYNKNKTDKILYGLSVYFDQSHYHYTPSIFQDFDWFPNEQTNSSELLQYLNAHDIKHEIKKNELDASSFVFHEDGSIEYVSKPMINYYASKAEFSFVDDKLAYMSIHER